MPELCPVLPAVYEDAQLQYISVIERTTASLPRQFPKKDCTSDLNCKSRWAVLSNKPALVRRGGRPPPQYRQTAPGGTAARTSRHIQHYPLLSHFRSISGVLRSSVFTSYQLLLEYMVYVISIHTNPRFRLYILSFLMATFVFKMIVI